MFLVKKLARPDQLNKASCQGKIVKFFAVHEQIQLVKENLLVCAGF
jgi:hypothetical protein